MMKKLLLPILALYMFTHMGCSSSNVQEDAGETVASEDENFAGEGEGDFAETSEEGGDEEIDESEVAEAEGEATEGEEVAEGEDVTDEEFDDESVAEGDPAVEDQIEGEETLGGDTAVAAVEGDEESEFPDESDEAAYADDSQPSDEGVFTAENPAPVETEQPVETESPAIAEAPVRSFVPLQKIKDVPFERDGVLLNRVYVARAGDTLDAIAQKIYGTDRTADLRRWNPSTKNTPWVGEKIYYSSPRAPQDSSKIITYFEDFGIAPQIHVTKEGENIRNLGQEFLGHNEGWKEIWSTNMDVASKGSLPAGVEIRYWPVGTVMAQNIPMDPVPQPVDQQQAQVPQPVDNPFPAPTPDFPVANPSPVDPNPMDVAPTPVPAPPVVVNEPTPTPVDTPQKTLASPAQVSTGMDDTTMMAGMVGLAALVLLVVFTMMKKNRARQIDLSQTQV